MNQNANKSAHQAILDKFLSAEQHLGRAMKSLDDLQELAPSSLLCDEADSAGAKLRQAILKYKAAHLQGCVDRRRVA